MISLIRISNHSVHCLLAFFAQQKKRGVHYPYIYSEYFALSLLAKWHITHVCIVFFLFFSFLCCFVLWFFFFFFWKILFEVANRVPRFFIGIWWWFSCIYIAHVIFFLEKIRLYTGIHRENCLLMNSKCCSALFKIKCASVWDI